MTSQVNNMGRPDIKRIVVDPLFKDAALPIEVAEKLSLKPEYMSKDELVEDVRLNCGKDLFTTAKKILFFTENKGKFLKKCPGSRGVICCDYYTINSVTGCPYDCSYCILQHYIENNPFITVFLNREKAIDEIIEFLEDHKKIRVGTGELADSLALDHLIDDSGFFLKAFEENNLQDRIQFEFKTKSAEIENLIEKYRRHSSVDTIAAYSVNFSDFQRNEEPLTATMDERISSMKRLMEEGVKISIHFDPVVMLDHLFDKYMETIDNIFSALDRSKIVWISMGGFRHTLSLTSTIQERWPGSLLLQGEMFPSETDNKLRYLASTRRRFYKSFIEKISGYFNGEPPLYMCMEKSFIWKDMKMPLIKAVFPDGKNCLSK